MKKSTLYFLHIPKAGGTSFGSALSLHYRRAKIYDTHKPQGRDFAELVGGSNAPCFDVVRGHFYFGLHRHAGNPFRYVTFLRNPIDRLVSLYQHDRASVDGIFHQEATNLQLRDFYEKGFYGSELDNGQVRRIAGVSPDVEKCDRAALAQAIENIDRHFVAVGLLEYYDHSLCHIASRLGWTLPPIYLPAMVNTMRDKKAVIDTQAHDLLLDNSRLDFQLHAHVLALNAETFNAPSTRGRVRRLRILNRLCSPAIHIRRWLRKNFATH